MKRKVGYQDLSLPRYRLKTINLLNKEYCDKMRQDIPAIAHLTEKEIRKIIMVFNQQVCETVIDVRDGVELPEQLGHIFIGTCPQNKERKNLDFIATKKYMKSIQHRNWESDNYVAKIFYSTFGSKYRFSNHELWGFIPCRRFKRTVGKTYPVKWKMYLEIDPLKKISSVYHNQMYHINREEEGVKSLENYNEFEL